jgi:hypothetical protein
MNNPGSRKKAQLDLHFTLLVALLICAILMTSAHAETAAQDQPEYAVKAAFLFKFGAFVEWPPEMFASPDTPLVIGIVGNDPFGSTLDNIVAHHTISGRPVTIVRGKQIDQVRNAHILFISQSEQGNMEAILPGIKGRKVLTVAEFDDPAIIIRFVVENDKVRFDVNLAQAQRSGLKLSSKLLSVARNVIKE